MAIKTPILRPLRLNGATLYVFPSASEDIGLNLNNGTNAVAMSHYALLNLTKSNFSFSTTTDIIKDLLNKVMNHEVSVLNASGYNYQEASTVSEHVFWNWLYSKRKSASPSIETFEQIGTTGLYKESFTNKNDDNRIVQCFGTIDAGNSLSTEFGMFNETYVTVPTSYGNGPVFFRKVTNNPNYTPGKSYSGNTGTYIWGRNETDSNYLGTNGLNQDGAPYTDNNAFEIVKDIPSIQSAIRNLSGGTKNSDAIVRSYDDVNIDLDDILSGTTYDMSGATEFKFNAILLYYSVYNTNDIYKNALATNLFGIVFLDGGSNPTSTYQLAPLTKKKSYNGSGSYFGNSYSFRVNIKTMSVYDNTDAVIQDNTTVTNAYGVEFNDVISNLNKAIDVMNTNMQTTIGIQNQYALIVAQNYDIMRNINTLRDDVDVSISERLDSSLSEINLSIDERFRDIKTELGLIDTTSLSSDGTEVLSTGQYINRVIKKEPVMNSYLLGAGRMSTISVEDDELDKSIVAEKFDILVSKNANVTSQNYVNLTARDINFNLKDSDKYASFSLINILEKIDVLQQYVDLIVNSVDEDSIEITDKENIQEYIQPLSEQNDEVIETVDVVVDDNKTVESNNDNDYVLEQLISLGIIPVKGILLPRAKKPEVAGYYLKLNTSGNIVNYVNFDGEEYVETLKCESGKMYSCNGLIYVFNGETCKLLGE